MELARAESASLPLHPGMHRVRYYVQPRYFVFKLQRGPYYLNTPREVGLIGRQPLMGASLFLGAIDFRHYKGVHCQMDYNGDGVVDDLDLPEMYAAARRSPIGNRASLPLTPTPEILEWHRKVLDLNRGCSTR